MVICNLFFSLILFSNICFSLACSFIGVPSWFPYCFVPIFELQLNKLNSHSHNSQPISWKFSITNEKHTSWNTPFLVDPRFWLINEPSLHTKRTRGVSHCELAIYIKKYVKAKEELWKFKYFTMQKIIIFPKSSKTNQNKSFKILL
jgi:hypothetical protein